MFRNLVTEALDKNNTIARSIINRMDHANWKNISEMDEANYGFIKNICSGISQRFDEASDEDKQAIMDKVYSSIHTAKEEPIEEEEKSTLDKGVIKQKILDYVKEHGAVLYPLEQAAEELSKKLSNADDFINIDSELGIKPDDNTSEGFKIYNDYIKYNILGSWHPQDEVDSMWEDLRKDIKLNNTLTPEEIKKLEQMYNVKLHESVMQEAVMNDIPHEIDDQIHILKDMRFDIEETEKNWDLAGMDVKPMGDITTEINHLIEVMYQKGAELADQEIAKSISDTEEEEKEKSSIDKKDNL